MKYFKKISKKIADFQSKVILTLVFFIILPPFALISKALSKKSKFRGSNWSLWDLKSDSLEDVKKQY